MLVFKDILALDNSIEDDETFLDLVDEIEEGELFFDIDDYEVPITTIGYEELITMINRIIYKLTEYSNIELLSKLISLKRVILKKNREAIMVQLMSYDYEILLKMCKEKNSELLALPSSADNKFYSDKAFNELFSYFWIKFENTCLSYSYEDLKDNKKITLINTLLKALKNDDDSPYLIFVTKGAINKYVSPVYSHLQDTRKKKLEEQKDREAREKALERVLPNNMKGQEILDFLKDEIDVMIERELKKPPACEKPKKKEKSLKEEYEQLELPLI